MCMHMVNYKLLNNIAYNLKNVLVCGNVRNN